MPLDTVRAKSKPFVFEELKREYQSDPAQKPYNWHDEDFSFTPPDESFLRGIDDLEELIEVEIKQTGGGYFDVYLKRMDSGVGNYSTCVGHIKRG